MILYIKRSIKFDLFSISGRFRKKSSDWNRKVTTFVILQVHFGKILQFWFGKITINKRIKDYIRSLKRAVFFLLYKEVKEIKVILLYNIELFYSLYIQSISNFLV